MIERKGGLFQGSYEIIDSAGKVVLPMTFAPHEKCALAVEDVGFSLSIHLPRLITGRTPGPAARPPSEAPAPRSSATTFVPPFRWQLDASVLGSIGTVPGDATLGFSAHVGARRSSYSISLGGRYEFRKRDGTDTSQVSAARTLFEAVPCVHLHGFVGCGLLQIGALHARVQDQQFVTMFDAPNAALGIRFGGEVSLCRSCPLNNLALSISADLAAAIVRRNIPFNNGGQWVAPFPTAAVAIGVRWLIGAGPSR
jgi:hypothetical protein